VSRAIAEVPGIASVSDLHVWTLTSGVLAMSGHACIDDLSDYHRILADVHRRMHDQFAINHVTVQLDQREVYTIGGREIPP
jgi:cobalt-zinc-cadmium efflux system protein